MTIIKAIERAYQVMEERNWDTVYYAIDLHGVCLKSTYKKLSYEWINDEAITALRWLRTSPEVKIILWSSCSLFEQAHIIEFFNSERIRVDYFNKNPEVKNTDTGCFDFKFYFSVLLDDKAGFDPDTDWKEISEFYYKRYNKYG